MSRLIDYGWIASTPVRFIGVVVVCLVGGLCFGVLCILPAWRESQARHQIRQNLRLP